MHYKTIVLSDIHLGTPESKAKEATKFLKNHTCDLLILNGDIFDGWYLKRLGSKWKKKHNRFIRQVLKKMEKQNTQVIYVRGNHDDFLDNVVPLYIGNLTIVKQYVYESFGKKYWVIHGDVFDSITTHMKWLSKLGDMGYNLLVKINKWYNIYRAKRGLPYYSMSREIKAKVKQAVSYISDFQKELASLAHSRGYHGVICGHIHTPAIEQIGNILYLNSGDWVESLSALVEDEEGNWNIIWYQDFIREYKEL
ncbi:MAG: UDP-2,3-diacylglucosamine diphosphatase [Bacteroidales bacterium]|nr:UDP-2,3-diacylglucosamine diphosphatase [Bacteroidales bacterium]